MTCTDFVEAGERMFDISTEAVPIDSEKTGALVLTVCLSTKPCHHVSSDHISLVTSVQVLYPTIRTYSCKVPTQ